MQEFSLYIHIPFCSKKCDYCHFYVVPDKEDHKNLLLSGLEKEWNSWLPEIQGKKLVSLYFGGGTPFLFGPERIQTILDWITRYFDLTDVEITLEANPENMTFQTVEAYKNCGINRLSIGLQALSDPLLKRLNRTHSAAQAVESVLLSAESGISNISVDLMYDLPEQSLLDWENTLKLTRELPITHLSLYNLTIEPHTVFYKKQNLLKPMLPDPETSTKMLEMAIDLLEEKELFQYEISAFAKKGLYSRHNTGYWTGRPFLGFGPSAFSYWKGERFRNVANLNRYALALDKQESPVDFREKLPLDAQKREDLVIRLRLTEGIALKKIGALTTDIEKLISQQFLKIVNDHLCLTRKGMLFYDSVASELI